ncbi:MAG: hypothetical protein K2P58_04705 [Hyphomonadaceae bacterium]|nr:hypothetical protein [Hyphomonadaceae bacterium]
MRFMLVAALVVLAGCATPCPVTATGPLEARFRCEDGSTLEATFTRAPDAVRVRQDGYPPVALRARLGGAALRYVGGGAELRGGGAAVRWIRPGAAETSCRRAA